MNVPGPVEGMSIGEGLDEVSGDVLGDVVAVAEGLLVPVGPGAGRDGADVGLACAVDPASSGDSPASPDAHPTAANPAAPSTATAARPPHQRPFLGSYTRSLRRRVRVRVREGLAFCALMFFQSVMGT
ncbi:hypothetical protein GCM10010344_65710 [Streptomyces bluensis]|nr:hypothetical protein GCM10010344_65710 [Streptomyces bluensis]